MHNISTRVVCVNGKHSYTQIGPFVLEKMHIMLLAALDFFLNYAQNYALFW